jgi:hypothetical protein
MKKKLLIIVILVACFVVYQLSPFGNEKIKQPTQISNKSDETNTSLADTENPSSQKKSKEEKGRFKGIQPQNDLERIWLENDRSVPVSSYLEDLFSEVDNGNPIAKFQLSFIHQYCFNAPENEEQLNQKLFHIKAKNSQQHLVDRYIFCEDYPRDKISKKDVGRLVMEAARAGHPIAKREFIKYAFDGLMDDATQALRNNQLIADLKIETFQHLLDARSMGDGGSLLTLGMVYEDGEITAQNYVEAYANYYAFNILNPGSSNALLRLLEEKLTQEEIDYAAQRGEQYVQCCN